MATKAVLTVKVELPDYEVSRALPEAEKIVATCEQQYHSRPPTQAGGNKPRLLSASVS